MTVAAVIMLGATWKPVSCIQAKEDSEMKEKTSGIKSLQNASFAQDIITTYGGGSADTQRLVYIDMGVNWGTTLRLYKDWGRRFPGDIRKDWEIFGFEASPLIAPYAEKLVKWLQHEGPKPPMELPPSGSSVDLARYARKYGCPTSVSEAMRQCMWDKLKEPLDRLVADPNLDDPQLIQRRLDFAKKPFSPNAEGKRQFTFIPAAVDHVEGILEIWGSPQQLIRGGALNMDLVSAEGRDPNHFFKVKKIDAPRWFQESFAAEDWIVLKMDVEGVEHEILRKMMEDGSFAKVDVLLWECHNYANCTELHQELKANSPNTTIIHEGTNGYFGVDVCSQAWEAIEAMVKPGVTSYSDYLQNPDTC